MTKTKEESLPITMTMRFRDPIATDKFIGLCRAKNIPATIRFEGGRQIVKVSGFKNKTAKTAFTSLWATLSLSK